MAYTYRTCPYCTRAVRRRAIRCLHCGSLILMKKGAHDADRSQSEREVSAAALLLSGEGLYVFSFKSMLIIGMIAILPVLGQLIGLVWGLILAFSSDKENKATGRALLLYSLFFMIVWLILYISAGFGFIMIVI